MRIRVLAVLFVIAGFCGTTVYGQLPERVTFRPATFGHSTYYGYGNANAGGSDKITYASTQYAQRGYRGGYSGHAVSRAYSLEPSKLVGYSPYNYGVNGSRHVRSGRFYTPIVMDDCLCGSGGLIESPQLLPSVQETEQPAVVETSVLPEAVEPTPDVKPETQVAPPTVSQPVAPPAPAVEPKEDIEIAPVVEEKAVPQPLDKEDPFGDVAPALPETVTEETVEEEDPFGDVAPALPETVTEEAVEEKADPFGDAAPVFDSLPATDEDESESDPFGADLVDESAPTGTDSENDPFADETETEETEPMEDAVPATDSGEEFDPFG